MDQEKDAATAVEDLAIKKEQAEEVRGGAQVDYFLKLHGVDGDVTHATPSAPTVSDIAVSKDVGATG